MSNAMDVKTSGAKGKIGIVGSGLIGKSWCMLFASAGYSVSVYDVQQELVERALNDVLQQMQTYEMKGLLRGSLTAAEQHRLIKPAATLEECVEGASYIQECVPEVLDLKKQVFQQLDEAASQGTILASSTSAMPCSTFTETLRHRHRCIVAHPINPPYLMPLVELVPASWTNPDVTQRTRELTTDLGQSPVVLKKEIPGFLQPRIQYAVIQEAARLALDDAISAEDIDKIFTSGIGLRYAFTGVLETGHLNAEGFGKYAETYKDTIYEVTSDEGPAVRMDPNSEGMKKIHEQLCQSVPLDKLPERRNWRDNGVARLKKLKREMDMQDVQSTT